MRTLFVTQLHSSTTEERLRSEFKKYGPVKRTKIIAYPWKKNCGFVEFEQESACQDALADMRFKDSPDKWQWKVCYAHTDDPGKSVEEEGAEEIDWLEELYDATVELHTGSTNSCPNKSYLKIDIHRHNKSSIMICHKLYEYANSIAREEGVILTAFRTVHPHPAAFSKKSIVDAMEDSSKELNLTYMYMNTRAYNDSLFMASISPVGMIFIPCYKGHSQKLEEYLSEEISNGVKVLALTLAKLALQ